MEPKFQSSFIPKGPVASSAVPESKTPAKVGGILGLIATTIFIISLVGALGVFGYKFYLKQSIVSMGTEIDRARASLYSDDIRQFIQLDDRLSSVGSLLNNHIVLSPLFDFLERNTITTIRFTEFYFSSSPEGLTVRLNGQARGYSAIALQSDIFNSSGHFTNPVFSDLNLDERGNILFSFTAGINPSLLSYRRVIESETITPQLNTLTPPVQEESESTENEDEPITTEEL